MTNTTTIETYRNKLDTEEGQDLSFVTWISSIGPFAIVGHGHGRTKIVHHLVAVEDFEVDGKKILFLSILSLSYHN